MLNYLYAVLESEARLAAAALGLDPGLGLLHADSKVRDSLASDLMEPVRPQVDAYVLQRLLREPLRRDWFFEQRNGNCRLMGAFAARLGETGRIWARAVALIAERIAKHLWSAPRTSGPAMPLTQRHRRKAQGGEVPRPERPLHPPHLCRGCGTALHRAHARCQQCDALAAPDRMRRVAE